ncbi:acetyl-CoA hydrolase/transferase family protein [Clostridium sp. D2Q-11]|uniref:Acetyl-CoA hydrolase/transferase family protein n=1 Tax=Anaeromonas frigoriresistens TaxID=2683708 RepID=A0A942V021_9FIRM|nr:acetyl-CoA hydrolase/transferase C-terminal domain-containing protein [Anaeromonas frigoriresistens]MBS4537602.1 acetyl-CoA hydrolase/transferase family protein [Anaeromonas frigoriresistens]
MNINGVYRKKVITVDEALEKVKSNQNIVSGLAAAEPKRILEKLHTIRDRVEGVNVATCLPMGAYDYFVDPTNKGHFHMDGWFYSPPIRKAHKNGNVSFIPNHLHLSAVKRLDHRKPDIYMGTCSSVDKHGYISLSLSATYEREMIENANIVILEINPNMPRTFGDTIIHIDEVDYFVEVDYDVTELPIALSSDKDRKIGKYIADLVEDGSTIQLGIGGIPNAVAAELVDKQDLGIHTEMFTDGMVDLYNAGVITGRNKTLMPGKMVATFALGSKKLYDFIDDNPAVMIMRGKWVNDPYIIGQNYKMVSINTTLQIDLTGQCASEAIGHRQFSGTGGQADTAIGAQNSDEGKSIIALYSTANIRVGNGDERKRISKIVPRLDQGSIVSLSRNDVDYVVTEYGVASLRGTNVLERVERLINIAHPDFREELKQQAKELMIW